ncbi:MAG: hypothetical protein WAV11_02530 [Minisyncoccia bacterium]
MYLVVSALQAGMKNGGYFMPKNPITGRGGVAKPTGSVTSIELVDNRITDTKYGYLSGYKRPRSVADQVSNLVKFFPELRSADERLIEQPLPPNAEGWFAIPRRKKIASNYVEAVKRVFDLIAISRNGKFKNCCEDKMDKQYFRQLDRTKDIFQRIGCEQKDHDILLIPGQFGILYRGNPVHRTLKGMDSSEYPFDTFTTAIMLFNHPERLNHYEDLWIDCGGDELASTVVGVLPKAPCFRSLNGRVEYAMYPVGAACDIRGSASGFLLQSSSNVAMQIAS